MLKCTGNHLFCSLNT